MKQFIAIFTLLAPAFCFSQAITDNGVNVGIGTTTPMAKLHVAGNLNLSAGGQYNIGGVRMLSANGTQNMFLGSGSGNAITTGQRNSFLGFQSGPQVTTGSNNAFLGYRTGFVNTTGSNNIFIGSQTGFSNTTGSFNAYFGYNAGYSNTTADYGLMLGYFAGYSNTTGTHNAFIGYQAGYTNQVGSFNVALGSRAGYMGTGSYNAYIGYQAGRETTTGENNAYIGFRAGYLSTTGGSNTFIGNSAGDNNTTGSSNTYIGSNAKGTAALTNATAIGANASVTASNSVVLGNAANVGIGTSAPTNTLHVVGGMRLVDGNQASGKVLVSDADGNATWQTPSGGGGTLDQSYDQGGAGVGRTISADAGALKVAGTDGLVVTGQHGSGATAEVSGSGTRMFFNPRKSAFRAGQVNAAEWDDANIGEHSFAVGYGSQASGAKSAAFGTANASGDNSFAVGEYTQASGQNAIALGYFSQAQGVNSVALGWQSIAQANESTALAGGLAFGPASVAIGGTANGTGAFSAKGNAQGNSSTAITNGAALADNSVAIGPGNTAYSYAETSIGIYGTSYSPSSTSAWVATDRLLSVGNGTSNLNLSDALVVLKNANTGIGISNPAYKLDVAGAINTTDGLFINGEQLVGSRWSANGSNIYRNSGRVGVGTAAPDFPLHASSSSEATTAYFSNSLNSASPTVGLYSAALGNGSGEKRAGSFEVLGGTGVNIAVRGEASGGSQNFGGYFIGNGYFSGNVGLGTTSPSSKLHVVGDINFTGNILQNGVPLVASNWTLNGANIYRGLGFVGIGHSAPANPLDVRGYSNNTKSANFISSYTGSLTNYAVYAEANEGGTGQKHAIYGKAISGPVSGNAYAVRGLAQSNGAGNAYGGYFNAQAGGTGTKYGVWATAPDYGLYVAGGKSYFNADGVLIGTTTGATGYMLAVDGKVICEEVKVQPSTSWPDYVFANSYRLKSLKEVNEFIGQNHHLPGVPSASDVAANGIELGQMQAILLEKIEEIMLYTIQQQEQIDMLKEQNRLLEEKLNGK